MKKALIVATVAGFIASFELNDVKILQSLGYEVHCATNLHGAEESNLKKLNESGIIQHQIDFHRKPFSKNNIHALNELKILIKGIHFDIIHCHTATAAVLTHLAVKNVGKEGTKLIYTTHGFYYYKGGPKKSWLLFYPIERALSKYTDVLITINTEDYKLAQEKFHAKKIVYVPGVGIDTSKFNSGLVDVERKRKELGLRDTDIMLLSVGELSDRKNHSLVLDVLGLVYREQPDSTIEYFVAGTGANHDKLIEQARNLGIEGHLHLLGFREDISELNQAADIFVFPSKQEGLPVALMEAIACKRPVLCSDIRGNNDLVCNKQCLFSPDADVKDADSLYVLLSRLVSTGRSGISTFFKDAVKENYFRLREYDLSAVEKKMAMLYDSMRGGYCRELKWLIDRYHFELAQDIPHGSFTILSVGELNENKNHQVVIRALAELQDTKAHYVIAGGGDKKDELIQLANELGVEKQVHLLGFRTDVADIYHYVDSYALPSIREGLNVSLMEAMASGLPCICGDIRGNRDLIDEGKGGFLVSSLDVKDWVYGIEKICEIDANLVAMYNINKIQEFTEYVVRDKMTDIYSELKN